MYDLYEQEMSRKAQFSTVSTQKHQKEWDTENQVDENLERERERDIKLIKW